MSFLPAECERGGRQNRSALFGIIVILIQHEKDKVRLFSGTLPSYESGGTPKGFHRLFGVF